MSKKKAFLIHLAASLFVFSILLMLIIYLWYPAPYFDVAYRMKWINMIAFVDLVLGPGLTLLIFRADKPSVKFDMTVILLLQISALSWGVWNAWSAHPKLNVFYDGQLYCLDRSELEEAGVKDLDVAGYMTDEVMTVLPYPESKEEKIKYLREAKGEKPMVYRLGGAYMIADKEITSKLGENQGDILELVNSDPAAQKQWLRFVSNYGEVDKDWRYFGFNCFKNDQVAVLDRKNNKIKGILNIKLPAYWSLNDRP